MLTEKYLESKIRHILAGEGYQLHKSRSRSWKLDNQCGYMITDANNFIVCGERYDMTLDDVRLFACC